MNHTSHIQRAVEICGGTQKALADKVGLTQPGVHWLLNNSGNISVETALKIEAATEGKVSRHDLRPDIFPKSTEAA
jgi:DNA-binding transcriptional regulator YdaS (Cro superfamily)